MYTWVLLSLLLFLPAWGAQILFDNTKAETAGNADWVIDNDQPQPFPPTPTSGEDWIGGISDWGFDLFSLGHEVQTLPPGTPITYGDPTNPLDLANFDLFIIDEPNSPFTQAEITAILNFVADGGALFLVSNHAGADRNNDGWDPPEVCNQIAEPLGLHFHETGEPYNNISDPNCRNRSPDPQDPVIQGPLGTVIEMGFHASTVLTLDLSTNPTLRGHVWRTGAPQGATQVMLATGRYGNGRFAGLVDSSPTDDGTGNPGNQLYNGWTAPGQQNNIAILNTCLWLLGQTGNTPPSITAVGFAPQEPGPQDTVRVWARIQDNSAVLAESLFYALGDTLTFTASAPDSHASGLSYFHIPPQPVGTEVFFYLWAMDDSGAVARTPNYRYTVGALAPVLINEILYDVDSTDWNGDGRVEASGDEWIELYNPAGSPRDLSGWILTDGEDNYSLPSGTVLAPLGVLVVFGATTGLRLGNGGDQVVLKRPDGATVDSVDFSSPSGPLGDDPCGGDQSMGRYPDGSGSWFVFGNGDGLPSPGEDHPTPGGYNRSVGVEEWSSGRVWVVEGALRVLEPLWVRVYTPSGRLIYRGRLIPGEFFVFPSRGLYFIRSSMGIWRVLVLE